MLPLNFIRFFHVAALIAVTSASLHAIIDLDLDTMSDVWERKYNAASLTAADINADADGDGVSNFQEYVDDTNPLNASSKLVATKTSIPPGGLSLVSWPSSRGKLYLVEKSSTQAGPWTEVGKYYGIGGTQSLTLTASNYFRVKVVLPDADSDGDTLSDWEELTMNLDPGRKYSEGLANVSDYDRVVAILAASACPVTISALDSEMGKRWPDPGVFVVRRSGWWTPTTISHLNKITVNFTLGGNAIAGTDYVAPTSLSVVLEFGQDEAYINITPITSPTGYTGGKTIVATLSTPLTGAGYTLGSTTSATINLMNPMGGKPSTEEAARFLQQATFGPTNAEIERVKTLGFTAWLDAQFARPALYHWPVVKEWFDELWAVESTDPVPTSIGLLKPEHRLEAWWRQAMRDDDAADPLRQRVAFALSEIFVTSDRLGTITVDERGLTDYYDMLLEDAFGNFRTLIEDVTRHPIMGMYLSSLRNRKEDLASKRYPDENYAREIMQLFTIGLWRLNSDGTQLLSAYDVGPDGETVPSGKPIPTYGQTQIRQFARVFTGMSHSKRIASNTDFTESDVLNTAFKSPYAITWHPMRMFDSEHELGAIVLAMPGRPTVTLTGGRPAGTTNKETGDADLGVGLDYLFNHPNVGPFIGRQLIQRLVTSNPSPAYVSRISAVFADSNGSATGGARGDLKAVIRAILTDPEARDYVPPSSTNQGMVREPYVRYVALARALNAKPGEGGRYVGFGSLDDQLLQRPLSAPSVFNFFRPDYQPAELDGTGLVAPELEIANGYSILNASNYYAKALNVAGAGFFNGFDGTQGLTQFNPTLQKNGSIILNTNTRADEQAWIVRACGDPDVLVGDLDRLLCAGRMTPATYRTITRALRRLPEPLGSLPQTDRYRCALTRLRVAVHLIVNSADYAVLR